MRENLIELSQRHQQLELELKTLRSRSETSCSNDHALDVSEKKHPSHSFSADCSFRRNHNGQADSQAKRIRSQGPHGNMHLSGALGGGFHKPFFAPKLQHRFASPDSTRASPANQPPPTWMASQPGSSRSDPGSASIAAHFAARRISHPCSQRSMISSAFGCVPLGMKP